MAVNKNDSGARDLWGAAYDAIPKSVFAAAAYHLADLASDGDGAGLRLIEEINALALNGIITPEQRSLAFKALAEQVQA